MTFLALGLGDDAGLLNEDIPKRSQGSVCVFQVIYLPSGHKAVSQRQEASEWLLRRLKVAQDLFFSLDLQHPQLSKVTEILISQSALCGQKVQLPPGNALLAGESTWTRFRLVWAT